MIYILHGDDNISSYNRIADILKKYPRHHKVYIVATNLDKLAETLQATNFLAENQIIICENVLSKTKEILKRILNIKSETPIIFWESKKLSFKLGGDTGNLNVEEFKLPSTLYFFLDSLVPNSTRFADYLTKLDKNQPNLNWHIANRMLLMLLAKKNFSRLTASKIVKKPLQPWQWLKITRQAAKFSDNSLLALFSATLKLDYLNKTGQTNSDFTGTTALLLLKHLKASTMLQ